MTTTNTNAMSASLNTSTGTTPARQARYALLMLAAGWLPVALYAGTADECLGWGRLQAGTVATGEWLVVRNGEGARGDVYPGSVVTHLVTLQCAIEGAKGQGLNAVAEVLA